MEMKIVGHIVNSIISKDFDMNGTYDKDISFQIFMNYSRVNVMIGNNIFLVSFNTRYYKDYIDYPDFFDMSIELKKSQYQTLMYLNLKLKEDLFEVYKEKSIIIKELIKNKMNNYKLNFSQYKNLTYNEPIEPLETFKVKLYDYQKKTLSKLIQIESTDSYKINTTIDFMNQYYDVITNTFCNEKKYITFTSKGGMLCDETGLGKTITSLALIDFNKSNIKTKIYNNKIFSKATLIICPSHLIKQWNKEIKKTLPNYKTIMFSTKVNHGKVSYNDIINADILIVSIQFLTNFKHYITRIENSNYIDSTPSRFDYNNRLKLIDDLEVKMETKYPILEKFYFHRIMLDEAHEILNKSTYCYTYQDRFLINFYNNMESQYKWYISGTPFTSDTNVQMNNFNNILNIQYKINNLNLDYDTIIKFFGFIHTDYIQKQILDNIMIRHLKEDVKEQLNIPGYDEEVKYIELTEVERNLYNLNKTRYGGNILQQLCCHPLIVDQYHHIIKNKNLSLEEVKDKLLEHHKEKIKTYENKLKLLSSSTEYAMLKKNYENIINQSKFFVKIVENLNKKEESKETDCSICMCELENPVLTKCGHIFCKECLEMCLSVKRKCPICKSNIDNELYIIKQNVKTEDKNIDKLQEKYGSKLAFLIKNIKSIINHKDNKILLFSQFDRMLSLIGQSLKENGIDNTFIKGNVHVRTKSIEKFRYSDNNVLLLSTLNSASGTNLTEATHIFLIEPINENKMKVKSIENQAIARIVRIGQKKKAKVIRLITKDTIEEDIYKNIYK